MDIKVAAVIYILGAVIFFLVGLYVAYRLIRWFSKLGQVVSGVEGKFVLLALGLSSVVFPSVLPSFFKSFLWFFIDLVERTPLALREVWHRTLAECNKGAAGVDSVLLPNCIVDLGLGFFSAFATTLKGVYSDSSVYKLRYDQLIYLLALWIAVALMFRKKAGSDEKGQGVETGSWLAFAYGQLSFVARKNILFFLTLFVGAYLSIASIAAIAAFLDKSVPSGEVGQKLSERLEEVLKKEEEFLKPVPSRIDSNPDPFKIVAEALPELKSKSSDQGGVK